MESVITENNLQMFQIKRITELAYVIPKGCLYFILCAPIGNFNRA